VLSSPDSVPEGVAFDPIERAFYASSLQGGSLVKVAADSTETVFRAADGQASIGGIKVDAQQRRLWVCAQIGEGIDNRVWMFDLETGNVDMEFLLGAITTNGSCNDLALDSAGIAYVTDPRNPMIYKLNGDTGEADVLAMDPLLADETGINLGLNGIVVSDDESALIVAKFFPPQLLRVSLPGGDDIAMMTLSGDALASPDGLAILNGDIYSVSGSTVSRVRPSDDLRAGSVVTVEQIAGLSTGTVAEGEFYVIKSDVTNFVLLQPLNPPFEILRVDLSAFDQ